MRFLQLLRICILFAQCRERMTVGLAGNESRVAPGEIFTRPDTLRHLTWRIAAAQRHSRHEVSIRTTAAR